MRLKEEQKFEILRIAYLESRKEASFWRERSWKTTTWTCGFFLTLSGVSVFTNKQNVLLCIPLIGISIMATIYLQKNFGRYHKAWVNIGRIESALGFFTADEYLPGENLFLDDYRIRKTTIRGTLFFILTIWIVALGSTSAMIFG